MIGKTAFTPRLGGLLTGVMLVGALHASSACAGVRVESIRTSSSAERTRVVLDLDRDAPFEAKTLTNPSRVLISFEDASFGNGAEPRTVGDGRVERVRLNTLRSGRIQVVLDLKQDAPYTTFTLANPPRIVVDVLPGPAGGGTSPQEPTPAAPVLDESKPAVRQDAVNPTSGDPAVATQRRAPTHPEPPRRSGPWRVAVDAGHGGKDHGAVHLKTREKDITFALATQVVDELNKRPGVEAFLTRRGDYFIPLRKRFGIADEGGADLFISLHCNASAKASARGTEVYFLSPKGSTDEASRLLAIKENEVDAKMGVVASDDVLDQIEFDMIQTDVQVKSEILAETVLTNLFGLGTVYDRGVKQAGFTVLKSPEMPSILVEAAFISNKAENKLLRDAEWRKNFARLLADGVAAYCGTVDRAEKIVQD